MPKHKAKRPFFENSHRISNIRIEIVTKGIEAEQRCRVKWHSKIPAPSDKSKGTKGRLLQGAGAFMSFLFSPDFSTEGPEFFL